MTLAWMLYTTTDLLRFWHYSHSTWQQQQQKQKQQRSRFYCCSRQGSEIHSLTHAQRKNERDKQNHQQYTHVACMNEMSKSPRTHRSDAQHTFQRYCSHWLIYYCVSARCACVRASVLMLCAASLHWYFCLYRLKRSGWFTHNCSWKNVSVDVRRISTQRCNTKRTFR